MKNRPRHMKKYTPRRRRFSKDMQKQQLIDFEHLLNMDLSSFLILSEEGTPKQIEQARVKACSDLRKYGSEMEAIGRDLGEGLPELVRNYIRTMKNIVTNISGPIDTSLVNEYRKEALKIKKVAA